jgi:hypothetical protein
VWIFGGGLAQVQSFDGISDSIQTTSATLNNPTLYNSAASFNSAGYTYVIGGDNNTPKWILANNWFVCTVYSTVHKFSGTATNITHSNWAGSSVNEHCASSIGTDTYIFGGANEFYASGYDRTYNTPAYILYRDPSINPNFNTVHTSYSRSISKMTNDVWTNTNKQLVNAAGLGRSAATTLGLAIYTFGGTGRYYLDGTITKWDGTSSTSIGYILNYTGAMDVGASTFNGKAYYSGGSESVGGHGMVESVNSFDGTTLARTNYSLGIGRGGHCMSALSK